MWKVKFFSFFAFSLLTLFTPSLVWAQPVIHLPYFPYGVRFSETAITWFGAVTGSDNYTDLRLGYSDTELFITNNTFDRLLWYDTNASSPNLQNGDAIIIYLQTSGINQKTFKITAQLNWWESRTTYQKIEELNGSVWQSVAVPFTSISGWRGNAPLDSVDDRGWSMIFHVPFTSLGAGVPTQGTKWKIAGSVLDKNSGNGGVVTTGWPTGIQSTTPTTWATLSFGIPGFIQPQTINNQTVTIRHKLNGIQVVDASVGGDTVCGENLDFFNQWGGKNYAGLDRFNIQNQEDVADWPCFNKEYIHFPLTSVPAGKEIVSARLILHEFGNSGNPGETIHSLIQVMRVKDIWDENTITWNNAPIPIENISSAWVDPAPPLVWPGAEYIWDVSKGVKDSYTEGGPFNIVIYTADYQYSSGKYFVSSDTGDWNEVGRPTVVITYGDLTDISPTPTLSPDRNNDTKVKSMDFGYVSYAYGSSLGQTKYDSLVDFNHDGLINFLDVIYLISRI